MKIINDLIIGNIRFVVEYETDNLLEYKKIIKIKSFLKLIIEMFLNNEFVFIKKFEDYKHYEPNIIKIITLYKFDNYEIILYYLILFFDRMGFKFLKLEIEIANEDVIKIIYDDYMIMRKKILTIIIPPFIRTKFVNFFDFYNKLFN